LAYGRPIGVAVHPGYATSYEDRSPQGAPGVYGYGYPTLAYGHYLGKREAEADASVIAPIAPLVTPVGVAAHPGYATSFEHRSPQGAPGLYGYGYGYPTLAYGHYLGKREAEADASIVAPIVAQLLPLLLLPLELLLTLDMLLLLNTEAHRVLLVSFPMLPTTEPTTTDTSK